MHSVCTVLQGKLDIRALRTITGQIEASLAVFVEDRFAELMVMRYDGVELEAVKVHAMGGFAPAITVNEQHNHDPTATFKSVCLVDGDKSNMADSGSRIFALPGDQPPEAHVFQRVLDVLDQQAARLAVSMQLPSEAQDRVKQVIRDTNLTNRDKHLIFSQIGDALDFTAEETVQKAFLAIWAQAYTNEARELLSGFSGELPRRDAPTAIPVVPGSSPT